LQASAADTDGTIARVDFYRGSTLLDSSTTAPYQFNWTNVAAGSYVLSARALDNAGATTASNNVNVTVTQPVTLPAAPSALTATVASRTRINLAWTDNATNETGIVLQRSTDGTTFATIATLGANVRTYANTGLTRNRTYTYRARAFNSAGDSPFSNTASATTRR
jgi:predicted phage tail protein